ADSGADLGTDDAARQRSAEILGRAHGARIVAVCDLLGGLRERDAAFDADADRTEIVDRRAGAANGVDLARKAAAETAGARRVTEAAASLGCTTARRLAGAGFARTAARRLARTGLGRAATLDRIRPRPALDRI